MTNGRKIPFDYTHGESRECLVSLSGDRERGVADGMITPPQVARSGATG